MRIPQLTGLLFLAWLSAAAGQTRREFLTPAEIEKIQDHQEIEKRVEIYLEAAALRLRAAQERITGKESEPGDPLEFFTVEDMLDGYYRIMRSVMLNLDGAAQKPGTDRGKMSKALKSLKSHTEKAEKELLVLKRLAEEKLLETVWNLVNRAIDIAKGAHAGAVEGLSRFTEPR
ncbi:MAG: hypothetical protein FJW35_07015 [Acidobacteria bacterium]|nr:hypothetical protein [Acidobacteriota bacterium]